jgi:hypothetical protein
VRNGIDKRTFAPPAEPSPSDGPLRIVVEGNPTVWFKGVDDAAAALARMTAEHAATLITPAPVESEYAVFDRVIGPLSHREMAAAYAETDVVLKLSRVEGMAGPPLEGFHLGATAVVTPVTGHDEYIIHGSNGVVTQWDDAKGTARWLDLLAADRPFLASLRANALETARRWPSWEQSTYEMAAALEEIASRAAAAESAAWRRLGEDIWGGTAELGWTLRGLSRDLDATKAELERVEWLLGIAEAKLEAQQAEFETRAFRLAVSLRLLKARVRAALSLPSRAPRQGRDAQAP